MIGCSRGCELSGVQNNYCDSTELHGVASRLCGMHSSMYIFVFYIYLRSRVVRVEFLGILGMHDATSPRHRFDPTTSPVLTLNEHSI